MKKEPRTVVWFRAKDLRIADHAPLYEAHRRGRVLPVFVVDPSCLGQAAAANAPHRVQFLLDSLAALDANLRQRGSGLLVLRGAPETQLPALAERWQADRVVAHRWVEPWGRQRDEKLSALLGGRLVLYEGETLLPPSQLETQSGSPYSVFTPFYRAFLRTVRTTPPLAAPKRLQPWFETLEVAGAPGVPTPEGLGVTRNPRLPKGGEAAARARLRRFLAGPVFDYASARDRLGESGTSGLSVDLKFGTLSVREIYSRVQQTAGDTPGGTAFLRQLVWRDFSHSILWHKPEVLQQPFQARFRGFPYATAAEKLTAWVSGQTGYPLVDAAARQLLREGFVHNRARMVAASFLTKHLLVDYREGERHYMKHLVDGDTAQNNMGWQWAAGCGCDAQPYFRVFNPMSQAQKFDPEGAYTRRYVPELAQLPTRYLHAPWTAPVTVLRECGVELGVTYPEPIVDHTAARERFLSCARDHFGSAPG